MTPKYGWCQLSWLVPPTRIEKHLDDAQASRCLPCRLDRQPSCLKPVRGRKPPHGFVGEFTQGEIPDPIPNSEVKTLRPMILLCGKVGDRRLDGPWWETTGALLFLRLVLFVIGSARARGWLLQLQIALQLVCANGVLFNRSFEKCACDLSGSLRPLA